MPRHSGVSISVQPVDKNGRVTGYVIAGFLSQKQLRAIRDIVDNPEYQRSKKWRGEYQEMAKSIVKAVDDALDIASAS